MLINVPDSFSDQSRASANSVSHRNRHHNNIMGIAPDGTKVPNGVDHWWDEAPKQDDNCWFENGEVTTDPPPPLMPSNCDNTSAGVTYSAKFSSELAPCAGAIESGNFDPALCPWFRTPPKPSNEEGGGGGGGNGGLPGLPLPVRASGAPKVGGFLDGCRLVGTTVSCDGLLDRPS
jgi:hypothetical protein